MNLPKLNEIKKKKYSITAFKGYNKNSLIPADNFYTTGNIVSDRYPLAAARQPRKLFKDFGGEVQAVSYRNDRLLYIKDGIIYFGKDESGADLAINDENSKLTPGEKEIVSMGAYALIYPDKKYFNTLGEKDESSGKTVYKVMDMEYHIHLEKEDDYDELQNPKTVAVSFGLTEAGADESCYKFPAQYGMGKEPVDSEIDKYWLDSTYTLRKFVVDKKESYPVDKIHLVMHISSPALVRDFALKGINPLGNISAGDSVSLSFGSVINGTYEIKWIKWYDRAFSNSAFCPLVIAIDLPTDFWAKKFYLKSGFYNCDEADIDISVPDIGFLSEDSNRLWGVDKSTGEIRACKQGNFRAWDTYSGLSSDSYSVSVGSDGAYTAVGKYLNYLLFFKEDCLHKLSGSKPANYQLTYEKNVLSVERGSEKSVQLVNDVLYYKWRGGICAYDGASATDISRDLGEDSYTAAVAASYSDKYYVSMVNKRSGKRELFVYDTVKGIWNRQDEANIIDFLIFEGGLYALEENVIGDEKRHRIIGLSGAEGSEYEKRVDWFMVSGDIGLETDERKYINSVSFTFEADKGSDIDVFFSTDGSEFYKVFTFNCQSLGSHSVPLRLPRCDHFRWKLSGSGGFRLFAIHYFSQNGSETDGNF